MTTEHGMNETDRKVYNEMLAACETCSTEIATFIDWLKGKGVTHPESVAACRLRGARRVAEQAITNARRVAANVRRMEKPVGPVTNGDLIECDNCSLDATIKEAGVFLCEDCAENRPEMLQPIFDARRRESDLQDWKDSRGS